MLDSFGFIKVVDFGGCAAVGRAAEIVGTAAGRQFCTPRPVQTRSL